MIGSFRAEWLKMRKRPAVWVLFSVLLVALVLLGYVLSWFIFTHPPQGFAQGLPAGAKPSDFKVVLYPQHVIQNALSGGAQIGGAICLILGVLMAGSEFGWGTYKTVFTQRPSRLVTWVAKIVVLGVLMLILTLLFFLVAAASAAFFGAIDGVQSSWPSLTDFAKAAGAAWLIFAMWASMGLFLAVIFKQSALAVGLGLVYLLIIEGIISAVVGSSKSLNFIIKPLPGPNANALVQSFGQARFGRPANPEPLVSAGQASIVLAVYCVVFLVVAGFLLQRRDVT